MPMSKQLSTLENPYRRASDFGGSSGFSGFIMRLKAGYKNYRWLGFPWVFSIRKSSHHNTIISKTDEHGAVVLGAIPTKETQHDMLQGKIRVSMLTADEESGMSYVADDNHPTVYIPLFDHSVIDPTTGKNITFDKFNQAMQTLKNTADQGNKDVYFHCMAGKSRSQIATIAYLYLNGQTSLSLSLDEVKKNMGWWQRLKLRFSKEKTRALQAEIDQLNQRLNKDPLPGDIAKYISFMRPDAKKLHKMSKQDADQAGFLGLMTLRKEASKFLDTSGPEGLSKENNRHIRVARDIGLMLQASLDSAFRDDNDRKSQEEAFVKMYEIYANQTPHINLLQLMIGSTKADYSERFAALSSNSQARFAILAQMLIAPPYKKTIGLPSQYSTPEDCAKKALGNIEKIFVGDQVELLRTFGEMKNNGLTYENVANKIVSGGSVDQYNSGIQLAELFYVVKSQATADDVEKIKPFVDKLNLQEQYAFVIRLETIKEKQGEEQSVNFSERDIQWFVKRVSENHTASLRSDKMLTVEQAQMLTQMQRGNLIEEKIIANNGVGVKGTNTLNENSFSSIGQNGENIEKGSSYSQDNTEKRNILL